MPISVNNTTITFNDATTQTTGFTNPIPVANGGTGAINAASARTNLGAGTGNGNGNGNGFGNGNGNGTVTSVATGNGLSGGTITTTGTLSVACPTFNTVGSYSLTLNKGSTSIGNNYSGWITYNTVDPDGNITGTVTNLTGTWKFMGAVGSTLVCRVS